MVILIGVIILACVFAWYVLRDLNTSSNVPLKKADGVNVAPPIHTIPETKVEEVVAQPVAAKVKKAKSVATDKTTKKLGRKKKTQ